MIGRCRTKGLDCHLIPILLGYLVCPVEELRACPLEAMVGVSCRAGRQLFPYHIILPVWCGQKNYSGPRLPEHHLLERRESFRFDVFDNLDEGRDIVSGKATLASLRLKKTRPR